MANTEHMDILSQGVPVWNTWRKEHPKIEPDLSGIHFSSVGPLESINLSHANLMDTRIWGKRMSRADFRGAYFRRAMVVETDFSYADFTNAELLAATFISVRMNGAILKNCSVYGVSMWNIELEGAIQAELVITDDYEYPILTVPNIEIAQFIYLISHNKKIRDVIDTITSKVVLILGRFTLERKAVLKALQNQLSQQNYVPILFDFEKPANRDLTETVSTLAHMARFIIVDLTDPSSAPYEVANIVPQTIVPVLPLLSREPLIIGGKATDRREFAMFEDLRRRYHWVLPTFRYQDIAELLDSLQTHIIAPAEQKARELTQPK